MTLNNGLVAGYHFSGDFADWTGNGNNASNSGTVATTDKNGVSNQARYFDTSSDYINVYDAGFSSDRTLSFSFKTTSNHYIFDFFDGSKRMNLSNGRFNSDTSKLGFYNGSWNNLTNIPVSNGVWRHLTLKYNQSSDTVDFYIDGIFANSLSGGGNFNFGNSDSIRGFRPNYTAGLYIDEVRIYNRALTDYEVYQLYVGYDSEEGSIETLKEGNELYYSYDNSDLVTDLSGNGNNGTNNGATTGVTGVINEAFDFDGSNDYVISPSGILASGSSSQSFTISTFLKMPTGQTGVSNLYDNRESGFIKGSQVFLRQQNQSNDGSFNIYNNSGSVGAITIPKSVITYGQYQHIVALYDHTVGSFGELRVYLNGVLYDSSLATAYPTISNNVFNIGRRRDGVNFLDGVLDETAIYSRALYPEEITELYNSGTGKNPYATPPSQDTINKSIQLILPKPL